MSPHKETLGAALSLLGAEVTVEVDRPLGSCHPRLGFVYPVNYGELPTVRAPDGGGLDAYVLGPSGPVARATGTVVAVVERLGQDDPKLVVATPGTALDRAAIERAVAFQELPQHLLHISAPDSETPRMPLHLLSMDGELSGPEIESLVDLAIDIKARPAAYEDACHRQGLLLLLEKTSTRTTLSFAAAISRMGGYATRLDWRDSNFSISPLSYEARYSSSNCDAIMARLKLWASLKELADNSAVPVINGCDNRYHPSQAVADLITIKEVAGSLAGSSVTYVGVHNNVTNSLLAAATRTGVRVGLITPLSNAPARDEPLLARAEATGLVTRYASVAAAAAATQFIYTDTWVDMEFFHDVSYAEERERRVALMTPYQLNTENLGGARPWIMHDMPIHPGYEISAELVESPRSVIFQQAENRLYAAKAMLLLALHGKAALSAHMR